MIPHTIVVVAEPFPPQLSGASVAAAIARGLRAAGDGYDTECHAQANPGAARADEQLSPRGAGPLRELALAHARALVLADQDLCDGSLPNPTLFELATRARQGGVPAYAVTGVEHPDLFQARMLDLQIVIHASGVRGLASAGKRLAALL